MDSSIRRPRVLKSTPRKSNSSRTQPAPAPRATRPLDRIEAVATDFATSKGCRSGKMWISVAKRSRLVATAIAEIAASTTHALAQITVSTSNVDVPRGDPGALALVFLRGKGIVASYPTSSGKFRRITYTSGNATGITHGINALIDAYNGG